MAIVASTSWGRAIALRNFPVSVCAADRDAIVVGRSSGWSATLRYFRLRFFNSLLKAPVSAPFMALPAVLFAFLLAFMASAAWQNISLARTSLVNEHTALARLAAVPIGPAAARQQMQAGLKDTCRRRSMTNGPSGTTSRRRRKRARRWMPSTPASGRSPASARDQLQAPTAPATSPSRPTSRRSTTCARRASSACRSATRARCG